MNRWEKRKEHIESLKAICGEENVIVNEEVLLEYGSDHTEDLSFPPQVLVKPGDTQEVANVMKFAFENDIPVTPIGALTGLSGGALSIFGGIGLSLERMNKILKIDTENMQVTTQPAVITQVLQEEVAKLGLYYAPDPASRGTCTIGGNLAENSGGPRAVKYGVTKDFVLNLEVVLPNGEVIQTGANTLKNSTGYNLTQLIVGSEGTLGIITKAVLKLLPLPKQNLLMLVPFSSPIKACEAVAAIFNAGITPSALEFMERDAIDWTLDFVEEPPQLNIADHHQAHLLIEVDGNNQEVLFSDCEKIAEVVQNFEADEIMFADYEAQKEALWFLRRRVGEAVKANSIYKEEDTVVPRFELPKLLAGVKLIGEKYGFKSVCYGHAGDGNLHINIVKANMTDQQWKEDLPKGIRELFELTVKLGGTISGEHGIGYVQKSYMDIPFSPIELNLMKQIKQVFDPKGILNPGKIWE
ncbi:MAG: FAD-binding protein [Flavobacteriales bacterium]|nr:FAD-binding protein [Flavobacteriales bacterium]